MLLQHTIHLLKVELRFVVMKEDTVVHQATELSFGKEAPAAVVEVTQSVLKATALIAGIKISASRAVLPAQQQCAEKDLRLSVRTMEVATVEVMELVLFLQLQMPVLNITLVIHAKAAKTNAVRVTITLTSVTTHLTTLLTLTSNPLQALTFQLSRQMTQLVTAEMKSMKISTNQFQMRSTLINSLLMLSSFSDPNITN